MKPEVLSEFNSLLVFNIMVASSYVLRTAVMNSSYGLDRAITMDHTPKKHRGKWNSIDSFYAASWCGSAMFGGELIEYSSIIDNFTITACMQLVAVSCNLLLFR